MNVLMRMAARSRAGHAWVCHQPLPAPDQGHFFTLLMQRGEAKIIDNMAPGFVFNATADAFISACAEAGNVTFFRIEHLEMSETTGPVPHPSAYSLCGYGKSARVPQSSTESESDESIETDSESGESDDSDESEDTRRVFCYPRKKCSCGGTLRKDHDIEATLYSFTDPESITHRTMRCVRFGCRKVHHYNYTVSRGEKINAVRLEEVTALFVNPKIAFKMEFLRYHETLQFRGFLSSKAIDFACHEEMFQSHASVKQWNLRYGDARFLYLMMKEIGDMDLFQGTDYIDGICVGTRHRGDELSTSVMDAYNEWLHKVEFPPPNKRSVDALVGDGHAKVLIRCSQEDLGHAGTRRTGRPRNNSTVKLMSHGWFMLVDPRSGRILSVEAMMQPENDAVVTRSLEKVLPWYPQMSKYIMDRNCRYYKRASQNPKLRQIKTWAIDNWHAEKHSATCPCSPKNHPAIRRAIAGLNTSIAGQTFSWFRGYASTFNTMSKLRHTFTTLAYCRRHNENIEAGRADYLNPYSTRRLPKKGQQAYSCTRKKTTKIPQKSKRAAKGPSVRAVKKILVGKPAARTAMKTAMRKAAACKCAMKRK